MDPVDKLEEGNRRFMRRRRGKLEEHAKGQSPCCAILTCADSRVIPEYIFDMDIGELFVIRIAGNIAVDETVLVSLEYAVDHLKVSSLLILGHTHCGAVRMAEQMEADENTLIREIRESFPLDEQDHVRANLLRQIEMIPQRSECIRRAMREENLQLSAAIYHLDDGHVEYLTESRGWERWL